MCSNPTERFSFCPIIRPELHAIHHHINTQYHHLEEVTTDTKKAADKLVAAGVVLGNQAVLRTWEGKYVQYETP